MSREVKQDFDNLITFLKDYSLEPVLKEDKFKPELVKSHKKYFSYLSILGELEDYIDVNHKSKLSKVQYPYLVESSSDIGSAIFHSINGSYKSARMLLRSSIETFLKGFCATDLPNILTEKSVVTIFEQIKKLDFFLKEPQKDILGKCISMYGDLCKDIHTATEMNMQGLTALKYFPTHNDASMKDISEKIIKLIPWFIFLLCYRYNTQFHSMHHRNKENIILSVKKQLRPIILGNVKFEDLKNT